MLSTRHRLIRWKFPIRLISVTRAAITRVTSLAGAVLILGVSPALAPAQVQTTHRDRGAPHGATPPTPPGIRVTYHGGSAD